MESVSPPEPSRHFTFFAIAIRTAQALTFGVSSQNCRRKLVIFASSIVLLIRLLMRLKLCVTKRKNLSNLKRSPFAMMIQFALVLFTCTWFPIRLSWKSIWNAIVSQLPNKTKTSERIEKSQQIFHFTLEKCSRWKPIRDSNFDVIFSVHFWIDFCAYEMGEEEEEEKKTASSPRKCCSHLEWQRNRNEMNEKKEEIMAWELKWLHNTCMCVCVCVMCSVAKQTVFAPMLRCRSLRWRFWLITLTTNTHHWKLVSFFFFLPRFSLSLHFIIPSHIYFEWLSWSSATKKNPRFFFVCVCVFFLSYLWNQDQESLSQIGASSKFWLSKIKEDENHGTEDEIKSQQNKMLKKKIIIAKNKQATATTTSK